MAFIRWIIGFALTVVIASFAVFNRGDVSIIWSPVHDPVMIPLYVVALGALAVGFVFGGVAVWLNMASIRREKRRQKRDLKVMEQKIDKLKEERFSHTPPASDLFPALPYKSK